MIKNLFLICCLTFIIVSCSTDNETTIPAVETQIIPDTPNPENDYTLKGLYQGTIISKDLSFHEKITINLGDNNQYNASIITSNEILYLFKSENNIDSNILFFEGEHGSFKVEFDQDNSLYFTDVIINEKEALIQVFKDRSFQRIMPSLGTFSSNDNSITGTWDFTFTSTNGLGHDIMSTTIFVNQNSETFVLDLSGASGVYQRLCSGPGTTVPIGVLNSSFFNIQISVPSIELGNSDLNFTFVANRLEAPNVGCLDQPSANLNTTVANWNWNGIFGTTTIDTSSLPDFSFLDD